MARQMAYTGPVCDVRARALPERLVWPVDDRPRLAAVWSRDGDGLHFTDSYFIAGYPPQRDRTYPTCLLRSKSLRSLRLSFS